MRLPSFPSESTSWRKLFMRSKRRNVANQDALTAVSYSSTNAGMPPIISEPTPAVMRYAPPVDAILSRASSEYSESISGGPPSDNYLDGEGDLSPDSPVSATSYDHDTSAAGNAAGNVYTNWAMTHRRNASGASSIPDSMTTASTISSCDESYGYGYSTNNYAASAYTSPQVAEHPSSRPVSLFSSASLYTPHSTSYAASSPTSKFTRSPLTKKRDTLVLTTTSRYPTGFAGERYAPVDVSMPGGGMGMMRRFAMGSGAAKRTSFVV